MTFKDRNTASNFKLKSYISCTSTFNVAERFNTKKMMLNLLDPISDGMILATDFPGDVREIIKKLKAGTFKLDVNYREQNLFRKTMLLISSQVTFAIILVALIIGQGIFLIRPNETLNNITVVIVQYGFLLTVIIGFLFLIKLLIRKPEK